MFWGSSVEYNWIIAAIYFILYYLVINFYKSWCSNLFVGRGDSVSTLRSYSHLLLLHPWHPPIYPGSLPLCHYTCCCLTQLRSTNNPSIASCSPRLDHYSRFEVNQLQIPLASYRVKIKNRRSRMWARSQVQHNTASLQVEGFFPFGQHLWDQTKEADQKRFAWKFYRPTFFSSSLFSPFPVANVSSSLDSGGIFTLFSAKYHGKFLLRVIFSGILFFLPTCWLCDLFYCLRKCWMKFGRMGASSL